MKVIVIDDDRIFRTMVRKFLERDVPGATLTEYDPSVLGRPETGFEWHRYDVCLLSHELGLAETGLDWLGALAALPGMPPIVYVVDAGLERLGEQARRLGARAMAIRGELGGRRLVRLLRAVSRGRHAPARLRSRTSGAAPRIEGYKVGAQVGRGALSRVYLAEREADGLTLVLKVIEVDLARDYGRARRFVEEAELVSELSSPHVVRVFDQGFTEDCGYMAMEFFPRGDLKQRIAIGIRPADALHCLANIAYGLEAIHALGIVHRDLKPANVMFRHDDTLALADFGIARRLASGSRRERGRIIGTPHYMSPEQARGRPPDPRNDLYSLGIIFYEMLTGHRPYEADTPAGLVRQHIHGEIPRLPPELRRYQGLLDRLLAKDPQARFESASELIAAL